MELNLFGWIFLVTGALAWGLTVLFLAIFVVAQIVIRFRTGKWYREMRNRPGMKLVGGEWEKDAEDVRKNSGITGENANPVRKLAKKSWKKQDRVRRFRKM